MREGRARRASLAGLPISKLAVVAALFLLAAGGVVLAAQACDVGFAWCPHSAGAAHGDGDRHDQDCAFGIAATQEPSLGCAPANIAHAGPCAGCMRFVLAGQHRARGAARAECDRGPSLLLVTGRLRL